MNWVMLLMNSKFILSCSYWCRVHLIILQWCNIFLYFWHFNLTFSSSLNLIHLFCNEEMWVPSNFFSSGCPRWPYPADGDAPVFRDWQKLLTSHLSAGGERAALLTIYSSTFTLQHAGHLSALAGLAFVCALWHRFGATNSYRDILMW